MDPHPFIAASPLLTLTHRLCLLSPSVMAARASVVQLCADFWCPDKFQLPPSHQLLPSPPSSSPSPPLPRRSLWPARVDLLIRSYVSDKFFLLEMLFDSIDQMWPKGIGDVILVLDKHDEVVQHIVPHWVKVRGGHIGKR